MSFDQKQTRSLSMIKWTSQALRLGFESLESRHLLAADIAPLLDINPNMAAVSSAPSDFIQIGTTVYFTATTRANGRELWKSDGTTAGTTLVKDIAAGILGSNARELTNVNGTLYFVANSSVSGSELWKSDGTDAGTIRIKDVVVGGYSGMQHLTNINGTLFFSDSDGIYGQELWKSDGTEAGTVLVKDIRSGDVNYMDSNPSYLTNVNGTLFFSANDGIRGTELWKSDGTSAGTRFVSNIIAGVPGSYPRDLTNINGELYFSAGLPTFSSTGLWKSNGTVPGTVLVKEFSVQRSFATSSRFINASGTLYFSANDGASGYELWKSDGNSAGTELVKDIFAGIDGADPASLTYINGMLYFTANDGVHGNELWKSDGTAAGTSIVKDISTGPTGSNPRSLTNLNGTLYFSANDSIHGDELWSTDGTETGTQLVIDIREGSIGSNLQELKNLNGTLYFSANGGLGDELWKSNGTAAETMQVKDINDGTANSSPNNMADVNGIVYFNADESNGKELWKSDGTATGTALVKDIRSGAASSNPLNLTNVSGTLYFSADDGINGIELWKSDGTTAGTSLVKDIFAGVGSANPQSLTNVNGTLYFIADTAENGNELWKSDGTAAGTTLVKDIKAGTLSSYIGYLTNINGTLYFSAQDGGRGQALWGSDGTASGTKLIKDIYTGSRGSFQGGFTNVNGTLFFSGRDANGVELWKSDGTIDGTLPVKDIRVGTRSSYPRNLINSNGVLYFEANGALWKSDGTANGTVALKTLSISRLVEVNGTLFFSAFENAQSFGLWKSDGTTAGTVLVIGVNDIPKYFSISNLTNVNGALYFSFNDSLNGEELWKSDGTTAGTSMAIDIAVDSSFPANLLSIRDKLFFSAATNSYGQELYVQIVDYAPIDIALSNAIVAENLPAGTAVGTFSTTDPDATDTFVYTLVSGSGDQDNVHFTIVGNQLLTQQSFDFETKSSYSIRVRSLDKAGLYFEKSLTISVRDTWSLSATLDALGNLNVSDIDASGKDNQFTISLTNASIAVADSNEEFSTAPTGWLLSNSKRILSRSAASFTKAIAIYAAGGADQLTVDFSGGLITNRIGFDGGMDALVDTVAVSGLSPTSITSSFPDASTGNLRIAGALPISYSKVDSVFLDVQPLDMVVNVPSGAISTSVTLEDDGILGNSRLSLSGVPIATTFQRPTRTLSLLGGDAGVTVNAVADLSSNLVLGTATSPLTSINFAGQVPVANSRNKSLTAYATNSIVLSTTDSDLSTGGTGIIQLNSAANIQLLSGSSITTENGAITLLANQQAVWNIANTVGIDVEGSTIQSTQGAILLRGKGGANASDANIGVIVSGSLIRSSKNSVTVTGTGGGTGSSTLNHGVRVNSAGVIGGGAAVTVIGNASTAVTSGNNFGVTVFDAGSQIASSGGTVTVTGVGGGSSAGTGGTNHGVRVTNGGVITSTGTSTLVSVTGTGGLSSGSNNTGVLVVNAGSQISSSSGNVVVNGTGGGTSSSKQNYGVWTNSAGAITANGTHSINVSGTGGNSTGSGTENYGLSISGAGSKVGAASGPINVTALGTNNSDAIRLTNGGSVNNTNSSIVLKADSMTITGAPLGTVNAGTGTITISPRTAGTQISLGGTDQLSTIPFTLGLSAAELNQITALNLTIGSLDSGKLTVNSKITRPSLTNLSLASASEIEIGSQINTAGGALLLGGSVLTSLRPTATGIDVSASALTLGASLTLDINSGVADIGYTQLRVSGAVNLNNAQLLVAGNLPAIAGNEALTIVSASSIAGTFQGLVDGAFVSVHGKFFKLKYSATTVQLIGQTRLFDLDHSGAITTAANYQSVLPSDLYTPVRGFGWSAAVTSLSRTTAAATPIELYQDKHVSSAQRSFFVSAEVGKTYSIRVHLGDQSSRSVAISVDGGVNFRTVATAANQYRSESVIGIVAASDRLEIQIKSGNTTSWAVDGIEVMQVPNVPIVALRAAPVLGLGVAPNTPDVATFNQFDVNRDGVVSPFDALKTINFLNRRGNDSTVLSEQELLALDADGSGEITPIDALLVINALNARFHAEGEGNFVIAEYPANAVTSVQVHDDFFANSFDEWPSRLRRRYEGSSLPTLS